MAHQEVMVQAVCHLEGAAVCHQELRDVGSPQPLVRYLLLSFVGILLSYHLNATAGASLPSIN